MPWPREYRQRVGCISARGIAFAMVLLIGPVAHSPAQITPPSAPAPAKAELATPADPFGRETPRSAFLSFLKYAGSEDYATAALYLQPMPGRERELVQRAREFQALHADFYGNIALLSNDPNGTVELGLPPGQVRAGVLTIGNATTDVILVRLTDSKYGKIWLVSRETVSKIPEFYSRMQRETPTTANRIARVVRTGPRLLGMSLRQWLGWLLSIPASSLLAWLLAMLLSTPRRAWYKLRRLPARTIWDTSLGMPIKCMIAMVMHGALVYLLQPPLLYRVYYVRFLATLLVACFAWLLSRIADREFDHAVDRTRTQHRGGESILIMTQRLTHVAILIIVIITALALFGLNVKTTLAGLGIGGLAIALAAQKTLENLIGGVSLLMDKAVQVGDFCEIGGRFGTVEDIGLRSLRLRTLDQNLLVVPNGVLAQMQFENLKTRSKLLIDTTFCLRIETKIEQLRLVLDRVQSMLNDHHAIETGTSRVRVNDFAGAAFELELFAYVKTGDWMQFTAIRQDVILKIAEVVEAAGTQLAAPTRLTYLSADVSVNGDRATNVLRRVPESRAND